MAIVKKITLDWNTTALTVYTIIRRESDSYRLNDADGAFAAAPADPYISLTEDSVIKGRYELSESRAVWTDGRYTFAIYRQTGGSPAPVSDVMIGTGEIAILSDIEVYSDAFVSTITAKLPTNYIMGSSVLTGKDDEIDAIVAKLPTNYIMGSSVLTAKDDEIDAIKVQTDKMQFDGTNYIRSTHAAIVGTVVTDAGNSILQIKTDLANVTNDAYKGGWLKFTSGVLINLPPRRISSYIGASKTVIPSDAWISIPADGVTFEIITS